MIKYSSDGKMYAMSNFDYENQGSVSIYNSITHEKIFFKENIGGKCIAFSSDSKLFAFKRNGIEIYNIVKNKKEFTFNPNFEEIKTFDFSPNEKLFAAAGEYETDWDFNDPDMTSLALWNLETGETIWEIRSGLYEKIVFSHDCTKIFAVGTSNVNLNVTSRVSMIDIKTLTSEDIFIDKDRIRFWDFDITFDENLIICSGGYYNDKMKDSKEIPIIIVDLRSPRKKYVDSYFTYFSKQEHKRLIGHKKTVNSIKFSPNAKLAVSASSDGTIKIWDIKTGIITKELKVCTDDVTFSPDGKQILFLNKGEFQFLDLIDKIY